MAAERRRHRARIQRGGDRAPRYTKDFPALARDTIANGRTAVLLAAKHPSTAAEVSLPSHGSNRASRRAIIASLLALTRVLPGTPDLVIRAMDVLGRVRPPGLSRIYGLVLDYLYFVGAADAAPPASQTAPRRHYLTSAMSEDAAVAWEGRPAAGGTRLLRFPERARSSAGWRFLRVSGDRAEMVSRDALVMNATGQAFPCERRILQRRVVIADGSNHRAVDGGRMIPGHQQYVIPCFWPRRFRLLSTVPPLRSNR